MAGEQREHTNPDPTTGAGHGALPSPDDIDDTLSWNGDDPGFQDVLECFRGFEVPVRGDFERHLAAVPAGPELAAVVAAVDLDVLDAHDRVEVVAACARLEAWAHAMKARAAVAVDRHWRMSTPITDPIPAGKVLVPERVAAATLSLRLQASPRETRLLITEGRCYTRGPGPHR